jgi:hypothetical protein
MGQYELNASLAEYIRKPATKDSTPVACRVLARCVVFVGSSSRNSIALRLKRASSTRIRSR